MTWEARSTLLKPCGFLSANLETIIEIVMEPILTQKANDRVPKILACAVVLEPLQP